MIDEIQKLLNEYIRWLKDKTHLRELESGTVEITAPYLDRHNDYIQIYVQPDSGGYKISDGGYTIDDLRDSGCDLTSERRKELLTTTLNGFGIKKEEHGSTIYVNATRDNFSLRKHNLIQAILAINDLFYVASPFVHDLFYEDVVNWLDSSEVRYTPKVKFTGKSGYDHLFDFVIPKSKTQPERILEAINRPSKDAAKSLAFSWIDTKEVRAANTQAYAILNDSEEKPSTDVVHALRNYQINTVLWSERDAAIKYFAG